MIVPDGITFVEGTTVVLTLSEKPDESSETDPGTGGQQENGSGTGDQQVNGSGTDASGQQENAEQQEEEGQNGQ